MLVMHQATQLLYLVSIMMVLAYYGSETISSETMTDGFTDCLRPNAIHPIHWQQPSLLYDF